MAYFVVRLEQEAAVEDYLAECVDVERFLDCCRACENYGRRWSCPPFGFDPLRLWGRFRRLRLYARVLRPSAEETMGSLTEGMEREKAALTAELLELERRTPGALALSAGGCHLCGSWARVLGQPCRQPEAMRYSIEALGGDVGRTMERYFRHPLVWSRRGEVPEYLTLVGGLLLK